MSRRDSGDRWKILASEYVIQTPYLRLRRDAVELPNGERIADYYVRESRGFAAIFALTPAARVVLVRQYKHGIGQGVLELPAGAIDEHELPAACARRELAEETGYIGDPPEPEFVAEFITDPTHSTGRCYLYLVRNARPALPQDLDATEAISVETASLADLRRYVRDGTIDVNSHVAAIYFMLDRLEQL